MRNIFFVLVLTLTLALAACAGKETAPANGSDEAAQTETAATPDEAGADESNEDVIDIKLPDDPVGEVRLKDGTIYELTKLIPIGNYYIYVAGKFNGHASTVISLTRVTDIMKWKSIQFKDMYNFVITSQKDQQLNFPDSRIYIGNDTPDTFTFLTVKSASYETEPVTINKADVDVITILTPKKD
jgi:hypothetical protein